MAGNSMSEVSFKAFNGQFNIDQAEGIVECFVAAIGNKDSVGDVVISGAFTESLKRRKPRVVWGHSWNDPIGKVLEIYEVPSNDPRLPGKMKQAGVGGLYAKVQFNLATEKGREAFASVAFFGHEQEWSIGYKTIQASFDPNMQANILKEVELYEVSPVLHGANQLTSTLSVKSDEAEKGHMPMGMRMPGFGPQQEPKLVVVRLEDDDDNEERDLFAEGEAGPISDEQRNALEMELMSRSSEPIKILSATENSAIFVRKIGDSKLMYRIAYHFDEGQREFMFGKPERLTGAAEARVSGTTVIPSQMPGMPMAVKPGMSVPMQPTQMLMQKFDAEKSLDFSESGDDKLQTIIDMLSQLIPADEKSDWSAHEQPEEFSVFLKTEQIYEAKQLLDPVLDYHRLEWTIDDEGIHVTTPVDGETLDALRSARSNIYSHFGRGSLGKAVGASEKSGAPYHQEVKALGGKLGSRIGGGLRSAGPGMSFVDITGTVDADVDGIVFEGKPGLERPIIPRFVVPKELARKLSKLTVGDAMSIEKQRRAGNTNIQFDENRLRSLIRDLGEDPSVLARMSDDGGLPDVANKPAMRSMSSMSDADLQREWDANKPYSPGPGVIGMNPMLEDGKVARRREILKEMRKRGMEPEGGIPANIALGEVFERARGDFDRLKPSGKPTYSRVDTSEVLRGKPGSRSSTGRPEIGIDIVRPSREEQQLYDIQSQIDQVQKEIDAWTRGMGSYERRDGTVINVREADEYRAEKAKEKLAKLQKRLEDVQAEIDYKRTSQKERADEAVRPLTADETQRMEELRKKLIDPRTGKPRSKQERLYQYRRYLDDYWKRRLEAERTDVSLRYSDFNGGDFEQWDEQFKRQLRELRALERRERGGLPISRGYRDPILDNLPAQPRRWGPEPLMGSRSSSGSRSKSYSPADEIFSLAKELSGMNDAYRDAKIGERASLWKEISAVDKKYTDSIDKLHDEIGVSGLHEESRRLRDAANTSDDKFDQQALMSRAKFIDDNLIPWFKKLDEKKRRMAVSAGSRSYSGPTVNGATLPTWDELSSMRRINGPTGLNKGYWFKDDATGRTFFAKLGRSDGHAQSEAAAAAIYRVAGSGVPTKAVIKGEGGRLWVISEKLENLGDSSSPSSEVQAIARMDMGLDMLLQNRDGWSGGSNKLLDPNGTMYTIDTGGAGIYRAQGGDKYPPFSPDAPWEDVATMIYRPGASWQHISKLFGRVSNDDFLQAMRQVDSINLVEADKAMKEVGTPDSMRKVFIDTIAARQKIARDYIDEFSQFDPNARVEVAGSKVRPGGSPVLAGSRSRQPSSEERLQFTYPTYNVELTRPPKASDFITPRGFSKDNFFDNFSLWAYQNSNLSDEDIAGVYYDIVDALSDYVSNLEPRRGGASGRGTIELLNRGRPNLPGFLQDKINDVRAGRPGTFRRERDGRPVVPRGYGDGTRSRASDRRAVDEVLATPAVEAPVDEQRGTSGNTRSGMRSSSDWGKFTYVKPKIDWARPEKEKDGVLQWEGSMGSKLYVVQLPTTGQWVAWESPLDFSDPDSQDTQYEDPIELGSHFNIDGAIDFLRSRERENRRQAQFNQRFKEQFDAAERGAQGMRSRTSNASRGSFSIEDTDAQLNKYIQDWFDVVDGRTEVDDPAKKKKIRDLYFAAKNELERRKKNKRNSADVAEGRFGTNSPGMRSRASDRRAVDEFLGTEPGTGSVMEERRRIDFTRPDDEFDNIREWLGSSGAVLQIEEQDDGSFVARVLKESDSSDDIELLSEDIFSSEGEAKRYLNREYSALSRRSAPSATKPRSIDAEPKDTGSDDFDPADAVGEREAIQRVAEIDFFATLVDTSRFGTRAFTDAEFEQFVRTGVIPSGKEQVHEAAIRRYDLVSNDADAQRRLGLRSSSAPVTGRQLSDRQMVNRDDRGKIIPETNLDGVLADREDKLNKRLRELGFSDDEITQLVGGGMRSRSKSGKKKQPSRKLTPEQVRISQEQKLRSKKVPGKRKDGPTKQEWGFRSRSQGDTPRFMTGDGFNSDIPSVAAYAAARRASTSRRGGGMRSRSEDVKTGRTEIAGEATFFKQILDSLPKEISAARTAGDTATAKALGELAEIMRRQKSGEVGPKRTNAGAIYLTQAEADSIIDALMFVLDRQSSTGGSRAPLFSQLIDLLASAALSTFIDKATPEIHDRFIMRENSEGRMVKIPISR